jgi:hypothetical protein
VRDALIVSPAENGSAREEKKEEEEKEEEEDGSCSSSASSLKVDGIHSSSARRILIPAINLPLFLM